MIMLKDLILKYFDAFANLYGIIPMKRAYRIIEKQNPELELTKEQFADVILEERLHELCCEHHRRFDLVRFGKLAEQVGKAYGVVLKDTHNLYPIPQQAIDNNDAMSDADQNPGY